MLAVFYSCVNMLLQETKVNLNENNFGKKTNDFTLLGTLAD